MKNKIINLIREGGGALLLLVMMLVGITQARAQTDYGIKIAGDSVTSENYQNLSNIEGVSGTITFDPKTYTLTLDNATIDRSSDNIGVYISPKASDQVTIVLKGENYLKYKGDVNSSNLTIAKPTVIRGPGTLNLGALFADADFTVIDAATINAKQINNMIMAGLEYTLNVVNATINVTQNVIIGKVKTTNCSVNWPEGVEFDESRHTFVVNGETATGISIERVRTYGILFNDVEVTEENINNLNEIEGVSGNVSYAPDTKTLTLDNATIVYPHDKLSILDKQGKSGVCFRNNRVNNLKIELKGDNKISSDIYLWGEGMRLQKATTICGDGNLDIVQRHGGIHFYNKLLVKDCTLDINVVGYSVGLHGTDRYLYENLTINNANVTVKIGDYLTDCSAINYVYSLKLEDCYIDTPAGAAYDDSLHCIAINGTKNEETNTIVIKRTENYGLSIAGVKVTNLNCKDLTVIPGVTKNNDNSTASYDPETKTLTLNDVYIKSNSETIALVNTSVDDLIINVPEGTSSDIAVAYDESFKRTYATELLCSTTITGGGTLKTFGETGFVLGKSTLTVDSNTTVKASGNYGIKAKSGFSAYLAVNKKGYLNATGSTAAISDIKGLDLNGVVIWGEGNYFDESLKGVTADGKTLEKEVNIKYKEFGLRITGVKVTSENYKDLSVIPCVSGTVEYYPEEKTLYLRDATIDFQDEEETYSNGIDLDDDSITISISGTNTVFCKFDYALQFNWSGGKGYFAKIRGVTSDATLNLYHSADVDWCGGGIYIQRLNTLLIDGCNVNIGGYTGIYGSGYADSNTKLIIRNAFVTIEDGIDDLAALTLDGVSIMQPSGATFDASKRTIVLDGTKVKDKIVIGNIVNYGLQIAGKEVTNANCNDLSVISGVSGKVNYNPATKTLTLDNARIDVIKQTPIKNNSVSDLVINIIGEDTLDNYFAAIATALPTTIKGDGILNISKGTNGIYIAYGTSLLIDSCTVNIVGRESCISGANGTETLTIHNANVKAVGGTNGVISNIASLTLRGGSSITSPENAWFSDVLKGVAVNEELVKDTVVITFDPNELYDVVLEDYESVAYAARVLMKLKKINITEAVALARQAPCVLFENLSYNEADDIYREFLGDNCTASVWPHGAWGNYLGFKINNVEVTKDNCGDLSVIPGVSGTVKYDTITKTLTLNNATITATEKGQDGIYVYYLRDLTISVTGENYVTSKETYALELGKAVTINGGGILNVTSETSAGMMIEAEDKTPHLFIDSCTVNVKGAWEGITGSGNNSLAIRKADVTLEGKVGGGSQGALAEFTSLTLTDCEITEPEGIKIENLLYTPTPLVIIKKIADEPVTYGLEINRASVTSENCNDLSMIPGVSGKIKYVPETKTLYLENATITTSADTAGIYNKSMDNLVIHVTGENRITSYNMSLLLSQTTTIKGSGTLNLESEHDSGIHFLKSLEIDSCTVNAQGRWGIVGNFGIPSKAITINNATVTATGNEGSILNVASLTLDGCKIYVPAEATFDETLHAVALNGETVTDKVVISPDQPVGIKDVEKVSARKQGIYSIDGIYLGTDFDSLPKGIYIKDGKKVLK